MKVFKQKKSIITGGSSGIGLALAKLLCQEGSHLTLIARRAKNLEEARESLQPYKVNENQRINILPLDVTDAEAVSAALNELKEKEGSPDLLVNSAGMVEPGEFVNLSLDDFHKMMDVNYFGCVHTIKAVLPGMITRGNGHIVNVSSAAGFLSIYGYTGYSGSKFALRGFSDALRSEMKIKGIDVSIVFPPDTDTPQLAYENERKPAITKEIGGSAGLMKAEDVARVILNGIRRNSYLIIPGFESKLFFHLNNLLGGLMYPVMDLLVNQAHKKTG